MLTPTVAAANFFWPPALYYYSFTRWWVVVGGLAIEAAVFAIGLRLAIRRAVGVSLAANVVSAGVGFLALWPVVFYERGIDLAMRALGSMSILVIAALLITLNISLEYWVAVRWCSLPRTRKVLGNVVVANLLSFLLTVALLPTWFKP
ncbi:MAG: hypothetical protein A3F92_05315 [Candidatus Rokubacteria bacterium RIFCSPLOWO2_12_FULL_71_22]|nr:MAG: hypothetical protein A3F92_05315 [Candidatus Rokubacteria bacterium RIFCSPLOWO2_12_FULL_71_22]